MGISEKQNDRITLFLGICVCVGIIWKEISLNDKFWVYTSMHCGCLAFIIIALFLDPDNPFKLWILLISVVYIGSIIIKQIYFQTKKKGKECSNDFFLGNFYNANSIGFIGYICLYILLLIFLMVSLLKRADDNYSMKGLDALRMLGIEYWVIFFLPFILVIINESTAIWPLFGVDGSKNKYISSQTAFEKIMSGGYSYNKDKTNLMIKIILMSIFIFLLFFALFNYTGEASPFGGPLFLKGYSGDGNGVLFVVIIILAFFNVLSRGLFIQECSANNIKKDNTLAKNGGEWGCEIAKYGGVVGLCFISYIATILYRIPIPRDKLIAIGFIIVSIFGFSELLVNL